MYGKPNKQLGAYQMGVQAPHRVLSKVPEKNNLQRIPAGLEGNHPKIVRVQGSGNTGRAHDAGSRASAVKYTTEKECVEFHGMPERRKRIFKDGCPFLCTSLYPDSPEKKWKKYGRNQNQAFLFRRRS